MFSKINKRRAFTLIEVIFAVMILALLAGVLFKLVQGTLEAAVDLNIKQSQNQELNGLAEVCRQTFQTLDGSTQFTAQVKPATGGGYVQEISIRNAPLAFAWTGSGLEQGTTLIAPRPQANGLLAFCLQHQIEEDPTVADPTEARQSAAQDATPKWFVLVRDLKKMEWRFFDPRAREWRKEWQEPTFRPSMLELTLNSSATGEDLRLVFPMLPAAQG